MTNEKSLRVAQGLSILSLLIASGKIDGREMSMIFSTPRAIRIFDSLRTRFNLSADDHDARARLLGAIEMVSP